MTGPGDNGGEGRGAPGGEYERLLALHHALRLNRALRDRSPLPPPAAPPDAPASAPAAPSTFDRRMIFESLRLLEPHRDHLAWYFFRRLFTDRPDLQAVFDPNLDVTRHRMVETILALALDGHDAAGGRSPAARQYPQLISHLGAEHERHGVHPSYYEAIGAALITTMRELAGAAWRPEYDAAWQRCYQALAAAMSPQAAAPQTTPPRQQPPRAVARHTVEPPRRAEPPRSAEQHRAVARHAVNPPPTIEPPRTAEAPPTIDPPGSAEPPRTTEPTRIFEPPPTIDPPRMFHPSRTAEPPHTPEPPRPPEPPHTAEPPRILEQHRAVARHAVKPPSTVEPPVPAEPRAPAPPRTVEPPVAANSPPTVEPARPTARHAVEEPRVVARHAVKPPAEPTTTEPPPTPTEQPRRVDTPRTVEPPQTVEPPRGVDATRTSDTVPTASTPRAARTGPRPTPRPYGAASGPARGSQGEAALPKHSGTVVARERRGSSIVVLSVRPDRPYRYQAGQYTMLESARLPRVRRPYSMATASGAGALEFHVRALPTGQLSGVLVNDTEVGDRLQLGPPRGTMTIDPATTREVLLVAGGTGFAPMKALASTLAATDPDRPARLFFGIRRSGDLYDMPALEAIADSYPGLRVVVAVSEDPNYPGVQGELPDVIARYGEQYGNWVDHDAYVSGPPDMVSATLARLSLMGVPPAQVRSDPTTVT